MTKHKFLTGLRDDDGNVIGTKCANCPMEVLFVNGVGVVPEEILLQECPRKREDVNQAAARIIREATERA